MQLDFFNKNPTNNKLTYKSLDQYLQAMNLPLLALDFAKTLLQIDDGIEFTRIPCNFAFHLDDDTKEYNKLLSHKIAQTPATVVDKVAYEYVVTNGMSSFVNAIQQYLSEKKVPIHLNSKLIKIGKEGNYYLLTFEIDGNSTIIKTENVIITLPFSTLREVIIDPQVELSESTHEAIKTLPYATHAKIGIHLTTASQDLFDDLLYYFPLGESVMGWPGKQALTLYVTANLGENLNEQAAQAIVAKHIEPILKQYSYIKEYDKKYAVKNWSADPFSRGSYSTFTNEANVDLNQKSIYYPDLLDFAEPIDNGHFIFAGEHTRADESKSHIEGAVRSGYDAARIYLRLIEKKAKLNK